MTLQSTIHGMHPSVPRINQPWTPCVEWLHSMVSCMCFVEFHYLFCGISWSTDHQISPIHLIFHVLFINNWYKPALGCMGEFVPVNFSWWAHGSLDAILWTLERNWPCIYGSTRLAPHCVSWPHDKIDPAWDRLDDLSRSLFWPGFVPIVGDTQIYTQL